MPVPMEFPERGATDPKAHTTGAQNLEILLGLGLSAGVIAATILLLPQELVHHQPHAGGQHPGSREGGEGGEGGAGGTAPL